MDKTIKTKMILVENESLLNLIQKVVKKMFLQKPPGRHTGHLPNKSPACSQWEGLNITKVIQSIKK